MKPNFFIVPHFSSLFFHFSLFSFFYFFIFSFLSIFHFFNFSFFSFVRFSSYVSSCFFIFLHFHSFSFIFIHFLSFSFLFFHLFSFSLSLLGAQNLTFFGPQFRYDFSGQFLIFGHIYGCTQTPPPPLGPLFLFSHFSIVLLYFSFFFLKNTFLLISSFFNF